MRKKIDKYGILAIVLAVCCLLLLPRCLAGEEEVFSVTGSHMAETGSPVYTGPEVKLSPGVYQVRIHGENLPEDGVMSAALTCPTAYHRALLGNTVYVYGGQGQQDFEVYVLDTLEGVRLVCSIAAAGFGDVAEVSVHKTNWGGRILLCLVLFCGGVVFAAMRFRDGILSGRIPGSRQAAVWILLAGVFIAYVPWLCDYVTLGEESAYHFLRIEGLKETLLHGNQFPVRVEDSFLYGHGYAASVFSGNVFLYVPAFLRIVGFPLMFAVKAYLFMILAAHAAISFHCLYRCTKNDHAALLGSLCTLLAPYCLYVTYGRGALGERTAMAFLPLVVTGVFLLYARDVADPGYGRYKWYLILGFSALLQGHLATCGVSVLLVLAFCLLHLRKTLRRQTLVQLVQAGVIVLLVNCFFWLPMLHAAVSGGYAFHGLAEGAVRAGGIRLVNLLQLTPNVGGDRTGPYDGAALQPGAALLLALLAFGLYGFRSRKEACRKHGLYFFGWVVAVLFLSTRYVPWDAMASVPALRLLTSAVQPPYRLLSHAVTLGGFFLAFFYLWMGQNAPGRVKKGCACFLAALCVVSAAYQVNDTAFFSQPVRLYSAENMGTASVGRGEFLPEGADVSRYRYHGPAADEHVTWSDYEKEGSLIRMKVANSSPVTEYVELPLTGYRGYVVTSPLSIEEAGGRGCNNDLRIAVPGGYSGELTVRFREPPLWLAADLISLLSVLSLAGFSLFRRVYGRRTLC